MNGKPGEPATILLVDDAPIVLATYGRYLELDGYRVRTAESGAAALEQLKTLTPALIVLDYMMPGMNGHELLSAIREAPATSETPVVFLTSAGDDADAIEKAFALGASAYLEKPVPRGLFVEMVDSLVG
jgi:CheY-like chemotaxis protein